MNKRRLLKLADMLEADAKNKKGIKFDLDYVGVAEDWSEDYQPALNCGTVACAMGLAAISGEFKRAGLSYKTDGIWVETTINGRRRDYDRAAMHVFGISELQAAFLFNASYYQGNTKGARGERNVAKRIRDLVAGKVEAKQIAPDPIQFIGW
jgi:hypothetical protein